VVGRSWKKHSGDYGYTTATMTLDTYGHLMSEGLAAVGSVLSNAIKATQNHLLTCAFCSRFTVSLRT
jgi:hypothetical protein